MRAFPLVLSALGLLSACSAPRPAALPPPPPPVAPPPAAAPPPIKLAPTFGENAGRLPWPATGTVIGFFGRRTDAASRTETTSVGIDVATAPAEPVRAVFEGTVNRVGVLPAFGTYVLLRHDGFTTVYGNLSATAVQQGDRVATGQPLGLAGTRDARRGAAVFFAVYEGGEAVDPLVWLSPR